MRERGGGLCIGGIILYDHFPAAMPRLSHLCLAACQAKWVSTCMTGLSSVILAGPPGHEIGAWESPLCVLPASLAGLSISALQFTNVSFVQGGEESLAFLGVAAIYRKR